MADMSIVYMKKTDAMKMLPELFDILYENMKAISLSGCGYDCEKETFLHEVGPALEKEQRKILLLYTDNCLAGYFQYYVNNGVFMVEEIQLHPRYQRTGLFGKLIRFLKGVIPEDTKWIEAYSHKNNYHSRSIMHSLGMECINEVSDLLHFRGDLTKLFDRF